MTFREQALHGIANLGEEELRQVVEYMAFLRYRARQRKMPDFGEAEMAALYAEFADEDRQLAEEGMADYAEGLAVEDTP